MSVWGHSLPALVLAGAVLGRWRETPLAHLHPTVRLAQRLRLEEAGLVEGTNDQSEAFRATGRPAAELQAEARQLTHRLGVAGGWFGAWVGLVLGVKLIQLSVRRRRTEFEPDRPLCVSCGRCFSYCPAEAQHETV